MDMNWLSYEEILGEANYHEGLSLWPYWTSFWPDHLLQEEELLPFCTTTMQSNTLQDELDALFEGDVLTFWDEMKEDENRKEGEKRLLFPHYSGEKEGTTKKMQGDHDTVEEKVLTFEVVSQYFCMPIRQAARELGLGLTLLKKKCRELGIPRWPHRKIKSLQMLIDNVQVLREPGTENTEEQLRSVIEMLQQERTLMEQQPHVQLEEKTKRLRQACFKANYKKKRRFMVLKDGEASG